MHGQQRRRPSRPAWWPVRCCIKVRCTNRLSYAISFYVGRQEAQSNTAQEKDSKKVTADIESLGEKGVNRRGGSTDPNFLTLAVPRLSVCADAQKVDRAKLAQTEVTNFNRNPTYGNQYKIFVLSRTCIIVRYV